MEEKNGEYRTFVEEKGKDSRAIYMTARMGAEKILHDISKSSLKEKLFLKSDSLLNAERYQNILINQLIFFSPEEELAKTSLELENLFPLKENNAVLEEKSKEDSEKLQIFLRKKQSQEWKNGKGNPHVLLEITDENYHIPFQIEIIPYRGHVGYSQEKELEETFLGKEKVVYYMFPMEEYLSRCFYEILNNLELINDMSWYKEVYDILTNESMNGRKVWDSFRQVLLESPIPSIERRLDTIKSYEDYRYMKKKWKSQSKREKEVYPPWEQVIQLVGNFFTPVFEGVLNDEVFIGDWMPGILRYLD